MDKKSEVKKKLPLETKSCIECKTLWIVVGMVGALLVGHIASTVDWFQETSKDIKTIQEMLKANNTLIKEHIEKSKRRYKADTDTVPAPIYQPR